MMDFVSTLKKQIQIVYVLNYNYRLYENDFANYHFKTTARNKYLCHALFKLKFNRALDLF